MKWISLFSAAQFFFFYYVDSIKTPDEKTITYFISGSAFIIITVILQVKDEIIKAINKKEK